MRYATAEERKGVNEYIDGISKKTDVNFYDYIEKGRAMTYQMALFDIPPKDNTEKNIKRAWERAFQSWSDKQSQDELTPLGICGYGSICDWCEDNGYGRPCVRALNAMCRERKITLDYTNRDFEGVWNL